ncbi:recombinase family protein [Candidatus Dependentiae bacterium]|nr:recombinase family protein [Candidatus Dependentiae bacterium]
MEKTVVYARVSTKRQETQGYSIGAQNKFLRKYAAQNNFVIVKEFVDSETARKLGRTKFNEMLKFLKKHKSVNHIIVEKTDRLLRNMKDYHTIEQMIKNDGLSVHLVKENSYLSKDSHTGEMFIFGIKSLMAKNHSDNSAEESRKGMMEKAMQGIYPSCAPYGYMNVREGDKKIIKPRPDEASFVREIFELYGTGSYSLQQVRKMMLAKGMRTRKGNRFLKSKIEGILKNDFYIGAFDWKDFRCEHASHKPLVSKKLFWKVQNMLSSGKKNKSRKGMFPYSGLMTCGVCGCALTGEIKKEKYIYYRCTRSKGNCKQPSIKQELLDKEFEAILEKIHITEDIQQKIMQGLRESFKDNSKDFEETVDRIEKRLKQIRIWMRDSYMDKLKGNITEEEWREHNELWRAEKDELSAKLATLEKDDESFLEKADLILELAKNASQLFKRADAPKKHKILKLMVSNCIYKNGNIDLELRLPFSLILKTSKSGKWCA